MKAALKFLKGLGIFILILPFLLIVLFVLYELVGIVVNSIATDIQTNDVIGIVEEADCEIIDSYSFTGNTGNGNHVDMLTLVIVRTENVSDLEKAISDDESIRFVILSDLDDKNSTFSDELKEMDYPDNTDNCFLVWKCKYAPFVDNIMGH